MKKEQGFSLIELLVVVTIIGVIAAIAIPNLRKARQHAESGSAIQSLRMITTAEHLYQRKYKRYGTLLDLVPEGTIDSNIGSGSKSNYAFVLTLIPAAGSRAEGFTCTATPQNYPASSDHFFVDETAVIRYKTGAPADASSTPIPR